MYFEIHFIFMAFRPRFGLLLNFLLLGMPIFYFLKNFFDLDN